MAVVHKSTIRRARQAERRRQRNRATLSAVKSLVKKVLIAVEEKKVDEAKASLREATSALSKAVTKGVLKRNTASRRVARLAARVNSLTVSRSA
jgi:small subunit ribosomal protein S20